MLFLSLANLVNNSHGAIFLNIWLSASMKWCKPLIHIYYYK